MTFKKQSKTCIGLIKQKNGRLIMAGDRRVSTSYGTGFTSPVPKIEKKENGMLIGASGDGDICHILVTGFEPPNIPEKANLNDYMLFTYLPSLKHFFKEGFDWISKEKLFEMPSDVVCHALIGVRGIAYDLLIYNDDLPETKGRIALDRVPTPFVVGCGTISAYPILKQELKDKGYNSKEGLRLALETAAEINDGCDNNIDFIGE